MFCEICEMGLLQQPHPESFSCDDLQQQRGTSTPNNLSGYESVPANTSLLPE